MDKHAGKETRGSKARLNAARFGAYVVLVLFALITLFSFYVLVVNATRGHAEIQKGFSMMPGKFLVTNFKSMLKSTIAPVGTGILNSLIVSTGCMLFACYFSALTAYGIHAYDFKLKKFMFTFILAIMIIPTQISAPGFVQLVTRMGLRDSFIPLIIPSISSAVVFFFMKQYMESALPLEIVEAARIDGSGEFKTFNTVVLPILKPAMAVQAIFTFVSAWNNYFVPALIIDSNSKKTMPIVIAQLRSADFAKFDMGQLYMTIAVAVVPIIVVYLLLSKFIVQGVAMGSVKG